MGKLKIESGKFTIVKLKNFSKKHEKKIILFFLCILLVLFALLFLHFKKIKDETVAVVNGYRITFDDILTKAETSPVFYQEYLKIEPKFFVEEYINQILLFQKAKQNERKYKKEIEEKMKNYYIDLLTNIYVEKELTEKIKVSEEEIQDYYNKNISDFVIPEKVNLYEIVTDSKDKAVEILSRLSIGESFEDIAERESISNSAKNGGNLGWIDVEKLDHEIASLVTKISPGQILANIFKTDMGYHIIKLAGRTERRVLTLEEARQSIINMIKTQRKKKEVEKFVKNLRENSKIQIFPGKIEEIKTRIK
ncbi:MAG TPA: peptidyl-prolyl cis-trans isomerase [bacterium]|nr:peptidyl-prolyl cis-trans isomerase [bacterium]